MGRLNRRPANPLLHAHHPLPHPGTQRVVDHHHLSTRQQVSQSDVSERKRAAHAAVDSICPAQPSVQQTQDAAQTRRKRAPLTRQPRLVNYASDSSTDDQQQANDGSRKAFRLARKTENLRIEAAARAAAAVVAAASAAAPYDSAVASAAAAAAVKAVYVASDDDSVPKNLITTIDNAIAGLDYLERTVDQAVKFKGKMNKLAKLIVTEDGSNADPSMPDGSQSQCTCSGPASTVGETMVSRDHLDPKHIIDQAVRFSGKMDRIAGLIVAKDGSNAKAERAQAQCTTHDIAATVGETTSSFDGLNLKAAKTAAYMDVLDVSFDTSKEILDTMSKARAEHNRNISFAERNIAIAQQMLAEATKAVGTVDSFDGRIMKTYQRKKSLQPQDFPNPPVASQSAATITRPQPQVSEQKTAVVDSQGFKDSVGVCGIVQLVEDEILPDHSNPSVDHCQGGPSQGAGSTNKASNSYWSRAILKKAEMDELVRQSKVPTSHESPPLRQDSEAADARRMRLPPLLDSCSLLPWNISLERQE